MQMHAQQGGSAAKVSTSHFRGTTNIEEYIRDMASRGFSRRAVVRPWVCSRGSSRNSWNSCQKWTGCLLVSRGTACALTRRRRDASVR